jgi:hypothetical protein
LCDEYVVSIYSLTSSLRAKYLKNNKITYKLFFFLWMAPIILMGQPKTPIEPVSFSSNSLQPLHLAILRLPEMPNEEPPKNTVLPLSAGQTILLDTSFQNVGIWEKTTKGSYIYRIGFEAAGAYGINAYFRKLDLKGGDHLFIYNGDRTHVMGPYDLNENASQFAIGFLKGPQLIIELNTEKKYDILPFEIVEIGTTNVIPGNTDRDYGDAGSCEVPVNCKEGENWQFQKDGVARILVKEGTKLFWCTGTLVNNTRNDGTPYLITANHCGKNATAYDYGGWIFDFNYEVEGCEMPLYEPDFENSMIGAKLLAHSEFDVDRASDFKLLLLNEEIPDDFRVFYNGWDRSGKVSQSGVTMHHPQGDVTMISTYDEPIVSVDYYNPNPNEEGRYWKVTWKETENGHGVTEGGSSGCPMFSSEGYLIGSLTGGKASCNYPDEPDYYGKLSYAWASEGTDSTRQLKYWLDPDQTDVLSLKGTNLDTTKVIANFSSDVTEVGVGEKVQFYNHSIGNIIGYEWQFEGGDPAYSESETPPFIKYNGFGAFKVKLFARSSSATDSIIREDYIKVLPTLSPNPSLEGIYKLSFGKETPENIVVEVFDMVGRKIGPIFLKYKNDGLYIDISRQAKGMYLIYVKTEERQQIIKASFLKVFD